MQGTSGVVRLAMRVDKRATKLSLEVWDREGQWVDSVGESRLGKLASMFSLSYVWTFGGAGETSLAEDQQATYSSFLSPMGEA